MFNYLKSIITGNQLIIISVFALLQPQINAQSETKKLSLNEAVEIGLKNNPEVKAAIENISVSKGRFWSGISLPQPEIGISYEYAPVKSSLSSYSEKTIALSQSFEFPSNYILKGSKYSKEEKAAVYKLKLVERSIVNQVQTSYIKVLAKQFQVKSAEENLIISDEFFKKADIRLTVGEGTNLEKLTAKVQATEARNILEAARNELKTAFAELNYSLGYGHQSYDSNLALTDSLVFAGRNINHEEIFNTLEENNPQIKIAELNYGIASVEKGLAWSSILPNINLSYFKQTRDGDTGFYGASFGISVPLWFMLDQRGKIQEAVANQSMAESQLQLAKNEAALKLKNAFTDHQNNLKQVKLYSEEILPQAEEIHRTAMKSYDAGELTYLEYLQARQFLITSRNNYINAVFNHFQSLFRIEELTGQKFIDNAELEN